MTALFGGSGYKDAPSLSLLAAVRERISGSSKPVSFFWIDTWARNKTIGRRDLRAALAHLLEAGELTETTADGERAYALAQKTTPAKPAGKEEEMQQKRQSADWREKLAAYVKEKQPTLAQIGRWAGGAKVSGEEARAEAVRLGVGGEVQRPSAARAARKAPSKQPANAPAPEKARRAAKRKGPAANAQQAGSGLNVTAVSVAAVALARLPEDEVALAVALAKAMREAS
jgi:hypothetical protein